MEAKVHDNDPDASISAIKLIRRIRGTETRNQNELVGGVEEGMAGELICC